MSETATRPIITSIVINKGGVGKTTTCSNLAAALCARSRRGHKLNVGVIDLDPQCNITSVFGGDEVFAQLAEAGEEPPTVAEFLSPDNLDVPCVDFFSTCPRSFFDERLHLLMGNERLGGFISDLEFAMKCDVKLPGLPHRYDRTKYELSKRTFFSNLRAKLKADLKGKYDFIIIDTPPSVEFLPQLALALSDYVVPVITPGTKELLGLMRIEQLIADSYLYHNPDLVVAGIILNEVNENLRLTAHVKELVESRYRTIEEEGHKVLLNTVVKPSVRIAEAMSNDRTIFESEHPSAQDHMRIYEDINDELSARVLGLSKHRSLSPQFYVDLHYSDTEGRVVNG